MVEACCVPNTLQENSCIVSLHFVISAVLITGGNSERMAEIYNPKSSQACSLPDLPDVSSDKIFHHTQNEGLLCGGYWTSRSCYVWNPSTGEWVLKFNNLETGRTFHSSWTSPNGTYLISGWTTTLIKSDGSIQSGFGLKYPISYVNQ